MSDTFAGHSWHDPSKAPVHEPLVVRYAFTGTITTETIAMRTLDGWVSEAKPIPTPEAWRFMVEEIDI